MNVACVFFGGLISYFSGLVVVTPLQLGYCDLMVRRRRGAGFKFREVDKLSTHNQYQYWFEINALLNLLPLWTVRTDSFLLTKINSSEPEGNYCQPHGRSQWKWLMESRKCVDNE